MEKWYKITYSKSNYFPTQGNIIDEFSNSLDLYPPPRTQVIAIYRSNDKLESEGIYETYFSPDCGVRFEILLKKYNAIECERPKKSDVFSRYTFGNEESIWV